MVRFLKTVLFAGLAIVAVLAGLVPAMQIRAVDGSVRCFVQETFYHRDFVAPPDGSATVKARAETDPVPDRCDAADDPAIWVNRENPEKSLILGTNKQASLDVYRLDGSLASRKKLDSPNNVDLREWRNAAGETSIFVGVSDKGTSRIALFRIYPETARLESAVETL